MQTVNCQLLTTLSIEVQIANCQLLTLTPPAIQKKYYLSPTMPLYMDVHIVPGVKARDVAEAHRKDILVQEQHECKCMTYWIDEERENIFCLIEAPNKEAVEEMHSKAHGLIPNKVIEVNSVLVESFLGRIYDPAEAEITQDGLKVFADPSYRILLVIQTKDPVLLSHMLGNEKAKDLQQHHTSIVRKKISQFGGREAEYEGNDFIVSFSSAHKAVLCALAIQKDLPSEVAVETGLRIGINSGEPVSGSDNLFGDTIEFASQLCSINSKCKLVISSAVKDLVAKERFENHAGQIASLAPQDETVLQSIFTILEKNWQNAAFSVDDFAKAMAMSTSQLYRKTVELFDHSPNTLLKEFRLQKAKELMKKRRYSISQITFDAGFTSPSYFTKCFKKKFDLLPMAYIDLLH